MEWAKCARCGYEVFGKSGQYKIHWHCLENSEKRAIKKLNSNYQTTLDELASNFPDIMQGNPPAKGFTIGRGKKLYWYISPSGRTGKYRCLPIEDEGRSLGYPVYHYPEKKVTIKF